MCNSIKYVVDRVEDEFAVCENMDTNEYINILLTNLPNEIKQGDIITFKNGKYVIDNVQTEEKKQDMESRVNRLWKK